MAKRRPGGYEVDRTATTRIMSQLRLSNRVPNIAYRVLDAVTNQRGMNLVIIINACV